MLSPLLDYVGISLQKAQYKEYRIHVLQECILDLRMVQVIKNSNKRVAFKTEFSFHLLFIYLTSTKSKQDAFYPLSAYVCSSKAINSYNKFKITKNYKSVNQNIIKLRMFNPQRRSKVADIYMQQKIYKLHLQKMNQIDRSLSLKNKRYQQEDQQQRYLSRIQKSKKQVQQRLSSDIKRQNHRLLTRLLQTDNRPESNPQNKLSKKHFNSYFSTKKQTQRVHQQNFTLVMRMNDLSPGIPSLRQLKKQYKQSRKYSKNCRKLPAIMKHQQQFKKKLSQSKISKTQTARKQS